MCKLLFEEHKAVLPKDLSAEISFTLNKDERTKNLNVLITFRCQFNHSKHI